MPQSIPVFSPDFSAEHYQQQIYTLYRELLDDMPVFRNHEGVVYLTRHEHVSRLLSDEAFTRQPPGGGSSPFDSSLRASNTMEEMVNHWMLFMDPPRHDVVRRAFTPMFTARNIKVLEPSLELQATSLIEALPAGEEFEFVSRVAFPFPVQVIATILGVPQDDLPRFQGWSASLTRAMDDCSEQGLRAAAPAARELRNYFEQLVSDRDNLPAGSLIHTLIDHPQHDLTMDEMLFGFALLLWAGHETTKNLISSGTLLLLEHPGIIEFLLDNPQHMAAAIEEILRYDSPVQKISRWASEDVSFDGSEVPAGTMITALLGAANRDQALYADPDHFDVTRRKNRHLAFGSGFHHCLGALLARTEGRILFQQLLPILPNLRHHSHAWRPTPAFRSLGELHLICETT